MALKLHLGCGKRFLPGFVHVDLADYPHIDHRHDIRTLPMFEDASADLIYSSHALGYFDRIEVLEVLGEWRRVLMPRGTLRLALPDFEALVKVYLQYGRLDLILGPLYGRWPVAGPEGERVLYERTVYDFGSLKTLLEHVGFTDIHRYEWRQTIHKDFDDHSQAYIPHMEKESGTLISLNVEATKPLMAASGVPSARPNPATGRN